MSFQVYMDWSWGYITCVAAVLVSLHWIANRGGRCSCGDIMAGYYWSLDRRLLEKCIPAASDSYHVSLDALVMTHFAYGGRNVLGATIVAFTIDSPNESFFLEVARCIRNSHGERERWIDIYKITKIVRALWLAERRVCMRVCFAFRALITQAQIWKSFRVQNSTSLLYLPIPSSAETWKIVTKKVSQFFFA